MCVSVSQRRLGRHAVDVPCEVITAERDESQLMWATDMSGGGAWLESDEPLAIGDRLVVCFAPGFGGRTREIQVFVEVARISRGLRRGDRGAGIGVRFLDLTPGERWALRRWLRPRPMPKPNRRVPTPRRAPRRPGGAIVSPFAARIG